MFNIGEYKIMKKWVVALQYIDDELTKPSMYLADWPGDPGRTTQLKNAKKYPTVQSATFGLAHARKYRDFLEAHIIEI